MKKKSLIMSLAALVLTACNDKETLNPESVLKESTVARTALDEYIDATFTRPYNISVTYRYVDSDFDNSRYLYPPTESKVRPLLEIVRSVWIDAYTEIAGPNFVKEIAPRQIALIGGHNYNSSGTRTLGIADSGLKITLFEVDLLDKRNQRATREYFHTIQHEYCHIINQKKPYDPEFAKITPDGYISTWYNVSTAEANEAGFITPYSMLNEKEDFAELTSGMLSGSRAAWDARVDAISSATGKAAIRRKEAFVVDYFKKKWNIDIYELQAKVEDKMIAALR